MLTMRMKTSLILGALLGIVCIVGAQIRTSFSLDAIYLFSFWYNRVLMGLVIGLAPRVSEKRTAIIRGAFLGLLVSFAFYSATGFSDFIGFFAGIVYGIIIEIVCFIRDEKQ